MTYAHAQKAFSLVELMIVIALIGIVATIAVPSYRDYIKKTDFRSAAREIISDLLYTKQRAISENRNYRISFVVDGTSYTIQRETSTPGTYETIQTKNLSNYGSTIKISSADYSSNAYIEFQPRGTCTAGNVRLTNSTSTAIVETNNAGRTYVKYTP